MRVSDRIRDKIKRNKNPERRELFKMALEATAEAQDAYFDRRYEDGKSAVWKAVNALKEGNRRRKKVVDS